MYPPLQHSDKKLDKDIQRQKSRLCDIIMMFQQLNGTHCIHRKKS